MHDHSSHQSHQNFTRMAISATLHCLTGCAIGEVLGLVIGTAIGLSTGANILLAFILAFVFGYALSLIPLVRNGLTFKKAFSIIIFSDTLSILTMEIADNGVMVAIPNAMNAGLSDLLFWMSMIISLAVAFVVTVPVNRYLLVRGKGHALVHEHMHH